MSCRKDSEELPIEVIYDVLKYVYHISNSTNGSISNPISPGSLSSVNITNKTNPTSIKIGQTSCLTNLYAGRISRRRKRQTISSRLQKEEILS